MLRRLIVNVVRREKSILSLFQSLLISVFWLRPGIIVMNTIWWTVYALTLVGSRYRADGAQILAMLPIAAKSHWNVLDAVLQTLVAHGHNVTAVTPFLKNGPVANYTEVDTSRLTPSGVSVPWDFVMGYSSKANNLPFLSGRHQLTCDKVFGYPEFWHAIESNKWVTPYPLSSTVLAQTKFFFYSLNDPAKICLLKKYVLIHIIYFSSLTLILNRFFTIIRKNIIKINGTVSLATRYKCLYK